MRPRRDGGLVLTIVGCLGLIAAIAGTVVLVHQGIPGQEQAVPSVPGVRDVSPSATPASTYDGIAQVSGNGERRHMLVSGSTDDAASRPVSRPAARPPAPTPTPMTGLSVPAGQPVPAANQPVIAGPRH